MPSRISSTASRVAGDPLNLTHPDSDCGDFEDDVYQILIDGLTLDYEAFCLHISRIIGNCYLERTYNTWECGHHDDKIKINKIEVLNCLMEIKCFKESLHDVNFFNLVVRKYEFIPCLPHRGPALVVKQLRNLILWSGEQRQVEYLAHWKCWAIITWQSSPVTSPSRKWSQFGKSEKSGDDIFEEIITGWSKIAFRE